MEPLVISRRTRLGSAEVRVTPEGRLHAAEALAVLGVELADGWAFLAARHELPDTGYDFGEGRVPTLTPQDFSRLAFELDTPQARRWQARARQLLGAYVAGDVQAAAEIAERSPDPERRRWLSARLESTEARKQFMAAVARHGGEGSVFREVSSISNRSVLDQDSASLRRERGARLTRDAMTAQELLRLSYLESASAQAIAASRVQGNQAILDLHRRTAERERATWGSHLNSAS